VKARRRIGGRCESKEEDRETREFFVLGFFQSSLSSLPSFLNHFFAPHPPSVCRGSADLLQVISSPSNAATFPSALLTALNTTMTSINTTLGWANPALSIGSGLIEEASYWNVSLALEYPHMCYNQLVPISPNRRHRFYNSPWQV
jgi:hypothetical protein